jgi:hypothetical protein
MIEMKNAYTGLVERNWNKEPLRKEVHLVGRIIVRPAVNKNIHLVWTYWQRIKVLRILRFQEMWEIS